MKDNLQNGRKYLQITYLIRDLYSAYIENCAAALCYVASVTTEASVTLWAIGLQAPLSMGFSARTLEWVAMTSSRGSSWPRDWTQVSCIGRQFLYHKRHLESPRKNIQHDKRQILDCERAEEPGRAGGHLGLEVISAVPFLELYSTKYSPWCI